MIDKSFLMDGERYSYNKIDEKNEFNFILDASYENSGKQPMKEKKDKFESIKFFLKDYYTYIKAKIANSILKPFIYLTTSEYRQNKILEDRFAYGEVKMRMRSVRRLLFFLGIDQMSSRNRMMENQKRSKTRVAGFFSIAGEGFSRLRKRFNLLEEQTVYPNLQKEFNVLAPEELWTAEIVLLQTKEGHKYFYIITDAYSSEVMGYSISDQLSASAATKSLKMALGNRRYYTDLIHHSKQGIHYCIHNYRKLLIESNIRMSASDFD